MRTRILAIGDTANLLTDLKKHMKNFDMHQIVFREEADFLIKDTDVEVLSNYNFFAHLKKINSIKKDFELCIVMNWTAAKLAYLANLNYIIYFVGADIRNTPFKKRVKSESSKLAKNQFNFLERKFYKAVLNNAIACVTGGEELFEILKKYRKDAIRIDHLVVDRTLFNPSIEPLNQPKNKFTFFCPQRISYQKGFDIIWEALSLCKTDFEVLQVEWYDKILSNKNKIKEILSKKPPQVKLIPQIPRKEMAKYYNFSDAVIGNMKAGFIEGISREAALCKKPVLNHINPKYKTLLDGKEIIQPFLPSSNDPKEVAILIDKIVGSKEFCEQLVNKQYEFIKKLTDPIKTAAVWETVIEDSLKKKTQIQKRNNSTLRLMCFLLGRLLRKITQF